MNKKKQEIEEAEEDGKKIHRRPIGVNILVLTYAHKINLISIQTYNYAVFYQYLRWATEQWKPMRYHVIWFIKYRSPSYNPSQLESCCIENVLMRCNNENYWIDDKIDMIECNNNNKRMTRLHRYQIPTTNKKQPNFQYLFLNQNF